MVIELKVVLAISYPSIHEYVAVSLYLVPVCIVGPFKVEFLIVERFLHTTSTKYTVEKLKNFLNVACHFVLHKIVIYTDFDNCCLQFLIQTYILFTLTATTGKHRPFLVAATINCSNIETGVSYLISFST